jgi:poly-gamma-glutamate capsule biosynthesis protein CapA/YwtB (metallophosphatase superfamily)
MIMSREMISQKTDARQSPQAISILLAGDLVLDVPDADHWLSGIAPVVRAADIAIGHLEVPHTTRGTEMQGDVPAPGAPPENLDAIGRAGFDALTLAGNHIADCGAEGIEDTIVRLQSLGVAHAGAGSNLEAARRPMFLDCHGRRIAVLSYNCVGPESAWATGDRAGCNYLRVLTADGTPIAPAASLRDLAPEVPSRLQDDIAAVRATAQPARPVLVIVAFHKGLVHTPAKLAPYERPLAEAAIDAGADIVIGHHAHIIRGIERYRDKPVFHGLGNGCVVTHALSPAQDHPARAAWARRRRELFGFEPDPAYTLAPFHPQAVNAMLGLVLWHADGSLEPGIVPVHVEPPGRPAIATPSQAQDIAAYLQKIGADAGLPPIRLGEREDAWMLQ